MAADATASAAPLVCDIHGEIDWRLTSEPTTEKQQIGEYSLALAVISMLKARLG